MWRSGEYSATEIAAEVKRRFGWDVTRSAILGKMNRDHIPKGNAVPLLAIKRHYRADRAAALKSALRSRPESVVSLVPGLVPVDIPVEPASRSLTIHEVGSAVCKYPHGDAAPYLFCGHAAIGGSAWCSYHSGVVFKRLGAR